MKVPYYIAAATAPSRGLFHLHRNDLSSVLIKDLVDRSTVINIANVSTKIELIEVLKSQVPLPAYCGENWDALEECLLNAVIKPVVLICGTSKFKETSPREYKTFLSILAEGLARDRLVLLSNEPVDQR